MAQQLTADQIAQIKRLPPEQQARILQQLGLPPSVLTSGQPMPVQQIPPQQVEPPKPECIFCKIVKKEIASKIIYEDNDFMCVLDIQPKSIGHTVILSKRHVAMYDELTASEASGLSRIQKEIISRLVSKLNATGYSIVMSCGVSSGQAMPHFAAHIIPTYSEGAVDLPILSILQPQKVPPFVFEEVFSSLSSASKGGAPAPALQSSPGKFYFD